MENLISWFEIPATNFSRAVAFYKALLGHPIEEIDMMGTKMGMFPMDGKSVSGAIVLGDGAVPSSEGVLVYLNGGEDLQSTLDKVEPNKGTILLPKTQISEEMGYFALFMDTEGNKIGIHSNK